MRRYLLSAVLVLLVLGPTAGRAQEPIRFARTPDISPDGTLVAFSYLGDIWTVSAIGGVARQITQHEAHEINPAFSPDGRWIAFSSNRYGSYDVFVVPAHGGKPTRLTYDSAADMVVGWSPDGKNVLFASNRGTGFPPNPGLYSVPAAGGADRPLGLGEAKDGAYSPKGDRIAYVRGSGLWYRKGYRGSSNDDIWLADADGTNHRRVTDFTGQDTSPMWSADGKCLFYVSELFGGPANLVCQDLAAPGGASALAGKPRRVTEHKGEAVRKAHISANGEWIVYECGPDLWIVSTRGGSPRKLAIEVHADDKTNVDKTVTFRRSMTEYAPSPDEKQVAFAVHGQIFLMPLPGGGKAKRLTATSSFDHGIAWAPDGKKLLFASDRSGHEDLYLLEPDDAEHPTMEKALKYKVSRLTNTDEAEIGASFAPDGKHIAFIRAGKLWTMNPDGSGAKEIVSEQQVFDYEWSPDGKWFAVARTDGSFASEIYLVPSDGSAKPRNVTRYATYNGDLTWSHTGGKIAFISDRRSGSGMYVLSLQKPAVSGAPASTDIDWDDIHLRVARLGGVSAREGTISPDGAKVAFRSGSGGDDLWIASSDGRDFSRMTSGNVGPTNIRWSKRFNGSLYFLDGSGSLCMHRPGLGGLSLFDPGPRRTGPGGGGGPNDPPRIPFEAKILIRQQEEYLEMFDQGWRAMANYFYDAGHHGADWKAVRERYRPLVQHVGQKEDLYALIHLMLGELNASHLGISGPGAVPDEFTADLGLLFDPTYKGPGLKIAEVLKRGPADKRGLHLKPGEVIVAIDREPLTEASNLSRLLNGKAGETLLLDVLLSDKADPRDPKARRRVEVQAVDRGQVQRLMYERWVARNAAEVEKLSKGTLGYIHIPSMDEAGLETFLRALYSDNYDKEAVVLDVRYNGGGFTHDQILNYLGSRDHAYFRQRDGGVGGVLRSYDRKWTKPLVVLINERSYSDAEIFPNAVRTLGLGKLVGVPTGGAVIGTTSTRLIDGSTFRVPRTGVFTLKGVNMEKQAVAPDVLVEPTPEQVLKGQDPQLEKAVEVLTRDVVAWKKTHPAVGFVPGEAGKPPVVVVPPAKPASAPVPMAPGR